MTDVYRTSALICPGCASPMREFAKRLVCDGCEGMLLAVADFESACADLIGDAPVELFDHAPSEAKPVPVCPRCQRALATCRVRVAGKKLKGRFSTCDRDGLWFGQDALAGVFALLTRTFIGYTGGYDAVGGHTRRPFQQRSGGDASRGMTIARWRDRPRKRAETLTPINAYRDQTLRCPVCSARDLVFMGDRWACDDCRGLFVESAALEAMVCAMIDQPWVVPAATGVPGAANCPVCRMAMTVESLEQVTVDRCTAHGVWFDPTELEVVLVREHDAARPTGIVGWLRRLF